MKAVNFDWTPGAPIVRCACGDAATLHDDATGEAFCGWCAAEALATEREEHDADTDPAWLPILRRRERPRRPF